MTRQSGLTIHVRKWKGGLIPVTGYDGELLDERYVDGCILTAVVRQERSYKNRNHFFWVMSKLVQAGAVPFNSLDTFRDTMTIAYGHAEPQWTAAGFKMVAKSINSDGMEEAEFKPYKRWVFAQIAERWGIDPVEFAEQGASQPGEEEENDEAEVELEGRADAANGAGHGADEPEPEQVAGSEDGIPAVRSNGGAEQEGSGQRYHEPVEMAEEPSDSPGIRFSDDCALLKELHRVFRELKKQNAVIAQWNNNFKPLFAGRPAVVQSAAGRMVNGHLGRLKGEVSQGWTDNYLRDQLAKLEEKDEARDSGPRDGDPVQHSSPN